MLSAAGHFEGLDAAGVSAAFGGVLGSAPGNVGYMLAVVAADRAEEALSLLRGCGEGENAAVIGTVTARYPGKVVLKTAFGGTRVLSKLSGAQLPRIC